MENYVSQWINTKLSISNIDSDDYIPIHNFLILWGLFEAKLFEKEYRRNKNLDPDIAKALDDIVLNNIISYYKCRYITEQKENHQFKKLKICNTEDQQLAINVLLGLDSDKINTVKAIIIIVARIRNNLFHGTKEFNNILHQIDNFNYANRFLIECLKER